MKKRSKIKLKMVLFPILIFFAVGLICAIFNDDGTVFRVMIVPSFIVIIFLEMKFSNDLRRLKTSMDEEENTR